MPNSAGGPHQGSFPKRRRRHKTPLPGVEPLRKAVDHAVARVVHGQVPVRCLVRRALHNGHGLIVSIARRERNS